MQKRGQAKIRRPARTHPRGVQVIIKGTLYTLYFHSLPKLTSSKLLEESFASHFTGNFWQLEISIKLWTTIDSKSTYISNLERKNEDYFRPRGLLTLTSDIDRLIEKGPRPEDCKNCKEELNAQATLSS